MSKTRLIGVRRKTKFSPNHVGNDGKIFDLTTEALKKIGYQVEDYTESDFVENGIMGDCIYNMARDNSSITRLKNLEMSGSVVVNSAYGIENCMRGKMTDLLIRNEIPHPKSLILNVDEDPSEGLAEISAKAYWIKRGDSHAIHREDVAYARNCEEIKSLLQEFAFRDIPNAVVNEHLVGDLVKFYGVADTDFFYWFYPFDLSHSKFGLEKINGAAKQIPFEADKLKEACDKAGEVLNVKIYGGDCVVDDDGNFKIIDFNDWPSFAPCREIAAPKIAECIHKQILKQ